MKLWTGMLIFWFVLSLVGMLKPKEKDKQDDKSDPNAIHSFGELILSIFNEFPKLIRENWILVINIFVVEMLLVLAIWHLPGFLPPYLG